MASASPYNNRIELPARGWHALCGRSLAASRCLHKSRQFPPRPYLPVRPLRPCSQLIRTLYGRNVRPPFSGAAAQVAMPQSRLFPASKRKTKEWTA
jgi:hypothetical protein